MTSNTENKRFFKKTFSWVALIAGAGLTIGAASYYASEQHLARVEREAEVTQTVARALELNGYLRQIGQGRMDYVKAALTTELADSLKTASALAGCDKGLPQALAREVSEQVGREQRQNPGYYATTSKIGTVASVGVIQIARH